MNDSRKKMIAPVAITVIFLVYLAAYIVALILFSNIYLIPLAIPLAALGIGMIFTLRSRIKEIRSGEEDDLGNY